MAGGISRSYHEKAASGGLFRMISATIVFTTLTFKEEDGMPAWNDILSEIDKAGESTACEDVRRKYMRELASYRKRNTIACYSGRLQKKDLENYGLETGMADTDKTGFMAVMNGLDRKKTGPHIAYSGR